MAILRIGLLLLLLQVGQGFKWMTKIKAPTVINFLKRHAGSKFGDKKLVIITGTSSGLGKATTKALLRTNKYHVIGAVRDLEKMNVIADVEGFDMENFTPMHLDLASFDSVNNFVEKLDHFRGDRPIDRLACNAAVYQPTLDYPKWTEDGHEQQLQINYLSHFLLTSKIMPMMKDSDDPRICMVGSVTGNDNTVGGGGSYPIADLKELEGLEGGCIKPIATMDGHNFNGAKAYKDAKLALMMTSNMLHERFHRSTGIAFSSIYPGCIAESPLFREKREWFRKYFPLFMKYVTTGLIGEDMAGQRLFQVLHDMRCSKSGVYWGWNGGAREDRGLEAMEKEGQILGAGGAGGGSDSIYENDQFDKVLNRDTMMSLWRCTTEVTGADWPAAYQPMSPCPTLKVVGAATSILGVLEEQARMKSSRGGAGAKIVANKTIPREERRKHLAKMLLTLDKTPTDSDQLEIDLLRTSGKAPSTIAAEMKRIEQERQTSEKRTKVGFFARLISYVVSWLSKILGWMTGWLRKAVPIAKTPKEVTEEDLRAAFANDNMKLGEEGVKGLAASPSITSQTPSSKKEESEGANPSITPLAKTSVDDLKVPDVDDPAVTEENKGPPEMIPGHELLGDTPVVFQPQNIMTMARVGQPLSEVASQADVFIRYKCRKGECKTCVVNIDGKWVSACQTKIPPVAPGKRFELRVRPVSEAHKDKETATFFSPKSLVDGGVNNALGMVGFVRDAFGSDPDFEHRMERERMVQEITANKAKAQKQKVSLKGK